MLVYLPPPDPTISDDILYSAIALTHYVIFSYRPALIDNLFNAWYFLILNCVLCRRNANKVVNLRPSVPNVR